MRKGEIGVIKPTFSVGAQVLWWLEARHVQQEITSMRYQIIKADLESIPVSNNSLQELQKQAHRQQQKKTILEQQIYKSSAQS
jgi:hypothetical protein